MKILRPREVKAYNNSSHITSVCPRQEPCPCSLPLCTSAWRAEVEASCLLGLTPKMAIFRPCSGGYLEGVAFFLVPQIICNYLQHSWCLWCVASTWSSKNRKSSLEDGMIITITNDPLLRHHHVPFTILFLQQNSRSVLWYHFLEEESGAPSPTGNKQHQWNLNTVLFTLTTTPFRSTFPAQLWPWTFYCTFLFCLCYLLPSSSILSPR